MTTNYYATFTEGDPDAQGVEIRTTFCVVPDDADPCAYIHEKLIRSGFDDHNLYAMGECADGLTLDEIEKIHQRIREAVEFGARVCRGERPWEDDLAG